MDPRIERHADVIVDHSTAIEAGDAVLVNAPSAAEDLVAAIYERLGERGAHPLGYGVTDRVERAYLRAADPDDFDTPPHLAAMMEAADAVVRVRGPPAVTEQSDVDPAVTQARDRANEPVTEAMLDTRWCLTQWPGSGHAQLAEMSTDAYREFVWNAVDRDWDAVREHQSRLADILEGADEVRIESGDHTDLTLSVAGNHAVNDYGEHNLPGGEVFTAPVPDSVEGAVRFDKPVYRQGREVTGAELTFEDGRVVDHSAAKNEDVLTSVLDTDAGARRVGELGVGMNRDVDRFTRNMLFDEKMGDTVHLAVGRAYAETVGEGNERNESATHVDMIVDMSEDSRIVVDDRVVQRDGRFVFEDGFGD